MIIDIRYHIASLIAVFLALGIGILIGSAVLGNNVNEAIVQQQKQIVDNLQKDFDQMRQENQNAQDEIANYKTALTIHKQFEQSVVPALLQNKLKDKNIAIIETSSYGFHEEWINNIKLAGAKVISVTTVLEGFDLKNDETRKALATKLLLTDSSEASVSKEIAREIAGGIISAQNIENLQYLEQLGLIKFLGEYGTPVDAVIFVGGSQTEPNERLANLDLPMIKGFLSQKISVYGVETSDVAFSYMKEYQKLKVTTVDNIDQSAGQVSLIAAISGKPGNFGIKPTARQLMPLLP